MGLQRELLRLDAALLLDGLCLGRQQDGATAIGEGLVEVSMPASGSERLERGRPVTGLAVHLEQGIDWPTEPRIEPQGALGELAGGLGLALALGLEIEAAEAELLGVGRAEHGLGAALFRVRRQPPRFHRQLH